MDDQGQREQIIQKSFSDADQTLSISVLECHERHTHGKP
jgi:hypothetical protein